MNELNPKPTIVWVIQDNQISPIILDYFKLLRKGLGKVNIEFLVPLNDDEALELTKPLDRKVFTALRNISKRSAENFNHKRNLIHDAQFPEGLKVWRTLILDDLGEGLIAETALELPKVEHVKGIIIQIPTPLGSSTKEEMVFNAWVRVAHQNNVPITGYEMLPLYSRWSMIPSMLDGIITNCELSFDYLSSVKLGIKGKIWKLPRYEGKVFTPGTSVLWRNGLKSPYHYRERYKIPSDKAIVYVAHNVAMSYEYRCLLEAIGDAAENIHIMFCIGKDQMRGTHSHEEIVKTTCHSVLDRFFSYSFHDLNAPWEMIGADAVLACSNCYSSTVAEANGIPCIILDEAVPPAQSGYLQIVNNNAEFKVALADILSAKAKTTDITHIIFEMINNQIPKLIG